MTLYKYHIGGPLKAELDRLGIKAHVWCRDNHLSTNQVYAALHNEPTTLMLVRRFAASLGVEAQSLITKRVKIVYKINNMFTVKPCGEAFILSMLGEDYPTSSVLPTEVRMSLPYKTSTGRYVQS